MGDAIRQRASLVIPTWDTHASDRTRQRGPEKGTGTGPVGRLSQRYPLGNPKPVPFSDKVWSKGTEWRTPPLWGFRNSAPYMHDGRAENLEAAVRLHDGQAAGSTRRFFRLSPSERREVEAFLNALIAPATPGASGVVSAAEAEARFKRPAPSSSSSEGADHLAAKDASRWDAKLNAGRNLERIGKTQGALDFYFYREVLRGAPNSPAGRQAAERIKALAAK